MRADDFDKIVEKACARIPAHFRRRMQNIAIVVEPEPSTQQLRSMGIRTPGTLLGLYEGRPLISRSVSDPFAMPDRITIFQGPHERLARDAADLSRLVEETVWHEVAHYFGLDERQVRAAEIRRQRATTRRP